MAAELQFPPGGVDESRAYMRQRSGTAADAQNVRFFEPGTDRARGGSRPGLTSFMDDPVYGENVPIQNLNLLVTNDAAEPATSYGQLIYGLASGSGFGLAEGTAGASQWTAGAVSGFAFACSCWDDDGNVYIATVNTSTGAVNLYRYSAAGVLAWTETSITVNTGSLRTFAGMVVIGEHLYVAVKKTSGSRTNSIHKLLAASGAVVKLHWYSNSNSSTLIFSTSAVNCIGKCGTLMGVDCVASGSNQCFKIIDTSKTNYVTTVINRPYTGTAANNRSKVISDGIAFFYVIASVTVGVVKKIGLGGVIEWASTVFDSAGCQSIAYDHSLGHLVGVKTTTPSLVRLTLTLGTSVATADPGTVTSWNNIDSDNHGFWTIWRDANGSNDIIGVNSTYSTVWGPTTFANTTHTGASVNKGKEVTPPNAGARQIRLLAVSNGTLARVTRDGPVSVTNGDSWNPGAKQVFSDQHGMDMYYVDGAIYRYYKSTTDAVTAWVASAGSLPVSDTGHRARLIRTWLRRLCLSGIVNDPELIYFSRTDEPSDFDDQPEIRSADQAFVVSAGDFVNCLIAHGDDVLIVGCDHSIRQFTGDPGIGGQFDVISETIGMAWGEPFCLDPQNQIYFFSSQGGVYKMTPGSTPVFMSQAIKRRLQGIDLTTHTVQMAWDVDAQGLGLWITPHDPKRHGLNFFYEERSDAWWPDFYGNKGHCPPSVLLYDDDQPGDRTIMLGGRDGHIRMVATNAETDDGDDIDSYVILGPMVTGSMDDLLLIDMQAMMADDSGEVRYDVYPGETPESALASMYTDTGKIAAGVEFGTWEAGRNYISEVRRAGHAVYIKVSSSDRWAMEKVIARFAPQGMVRRRMV